MKESVLKIITIVILCTMFLNVIFPTIYAYEASKEEQVEDEKLEDNEDVTENENLNEEENADMSTDTLDEEQEQETEQEIKADDENEETSLNSESQPVMQNKIMEEKAIEDGIYEIASAKDDTKLITMDQSFNMVINKRLNSKTQKFKIVHIENGYYTIQVLENNQVLDVAGGINTAGTNVKAHTANGTSAQKWLIKDEGNGEYSIVSDIGGLCLDIEGGFTNDGTNLQVYVNNGTKAQRFKFKKISVIEGKQTIPNGEYYIKTAKDASKVLEVDSSKSNIQINQRTNRDNQRFYIEYITDGYYTIENKKENKVFDVANGDTANRTNVQAHKSNGTSAQKWIIKDEGNNKYSIISWKSELYLDIADGKFDNGTNVQIYNGNGTEAQKFTFEKVHKTQRKKTIEDGQYKIVSALNSRMVLSANSNSNVELCSTTNEYNERFNIKYIGDGYYTIQILSTGKMLDVKGGSLEICSNVQVHNNNGTEAQQWIIKELGNGYYSIISKLNDLNVDVYNAEAAEGTNIHMYEENGSDAQKFKFIRVDEEGKQTLNDGIYKIKTALNPQMVLDISGGSKEDYANLQIWTDTNVKQQRFYIKYIGNGLYSIRPVHSRKSLDVDNSSQRIGTNVKQYYYKDVGAQQWIIKETTDGYYNIISKCNYLYLDIQNGQAENGTNARVYSKNETNAQKFIFEKMEESAIDDGVYEIQMSKDANKVLDISAGSFDNHANVQIWTRDNVNQQKFVVTYNKDEKNYTIQSVHSGKFLDVEGGQAINRTNVQQYDANGANAQKWKIEDLGDGTYNIVSQCGGLVLDVDNGSTNNGTNVQIYRSNGTEAQKFVFVKTEIVPKNVLDYSSINNSKYPGYKARLDQLKSKYPNWKIRVVYTGLDWNSVIDNEYDFSASGAPRSLIQAPWLNEWKSSEDDNKYDVSQTWYRASKKGIAYMMDPRNSLEEEWIFQFQNLGSSSGTYQDIAKMVEGTFLNSDSCIKAILEAAREQNISPFHITSRILHEQGSDGRGVMNGYMYMGRKVYNLYNIAVTGNTEAGIIAGAKYAYARQWFTPEASIKGGAEFLKKNYISKGQSTLYFQKYNVISSPLYEHQYMQNIRAANDEGNRIYKSYKSQGLLDCQFEFLIPIFDNMPAADSPVPKR